MASETRFPNAPILLFLLFGFCTGKDTITPTQSITDGEILVSTGENFALGFFSPGNSRNRYVGIWYNKVPEQTVVWIANRGSPINDSTGGLTINSGNLVIFDRNRNTTLWSTNVSILTNNSSAQLLDSGNLVLREENHDNDKRIVWQSFEDPTHIVLPNMKLGLNRKTGVNRFLTSWKSHDDPAHGGFTFGIDPRGSPQFFLNNGSARYWRTGPWTGRGLSGVPETTLAYFINFHFYNQQNEVSMAYNHSNASIISKFMLDDSGSVQRAIWLDHDRRWNIIWSSPRDRCDVYGRCGAYGSCNSNNAQECVCLPGFEPKSPEDWYLRDGSDGCVRKRILECGKGDGFLKLANIKVPDTVIAQVDMSLSIKECEIECLRNCSCTAYASAGTKGGGSGCVTWYGDLMDIRVYSAWGQDLYFRVDAIELAASASSNSKGFGGKKRTLVIVLVPVVFGLLLWISCHYSLLKKAKREGLMKKERDPEKLMFNLHSRLPHSKDPPGSYELEESRTKIELPFFDLGVVAAATDNFSSINKLGQGGFGPVYRGQLLDGQEIAVKRLSKNSGQGIEELKNEVMLIAQLQHRNLIRLLGCCIQGEEKMLIYEYMPNKSLDSFIFDQTRRKLLDWIKRFEIIVGIARGILYLHQDSRLRIIHRDLKASNVLLDAQMEPKISDFGTSRILGWNQTQANTKRVVGTYGYMSPEYALAGLFSVKSDVFSFGVLLLEIISGKQNNDYCHEDPTLNLIGHAWDLWRKGKGLELADSSMSNSCPAHEVLRCIQVGLLCVQESATDRPTMSTVVFMLVNETTIPPPKQPAFSLRKTLKDQASSTTRKRSCSINKVTITVVEGR